MSSTDDSRDRSPGVRTPLERKRDLDWAQTFESSYKPPRLLKPKHKTNIKQYLSFKQGRDGTRALCCFCNIDFGLKDLQIHHHDHDRTNNQLTNLDSACGPCNNREKGVYYSTVVSVITPKKQSESAVSNSSEREIEQAIAKLPAMKKKLEYLPQVQAYFVVCILPGKEWVSLQAVKEDIISLTHCASETCDEYIEMFSRGRFAGWRQLRQDADGNDLEEICIKAFEQSLDYVSAVRTVRDDLVDSIIERAGITSKKQVIKEHIAKIREQPISGVGPQ